MSAPGSAGADTGCGAPRVPTGNLYDKYGSTNPVARRLMAGFERALGELLSLADPRSVLDVGCGEGVLTDRIALLPGVQRVVGVDLADPQLASQWAARRRSGGPQFRVMRAEQLDFGDGEFELVAALEVLEHLPRPELALAEMARVASGWLLLSTPREPLWRALNVLRGAYVLALGNTPGHLHHFSRRRLRALAACHGEVVASRSPLPWTMLLARLR
jgi:2-polyprenyl-3-methyl-5-hydroxy-6-metoxy-1,4-benzoquinol methylase